MNNFQYENFIESHHESNRKDDFVTKSCDSMNSNQRCHVYTTDRNRYITKYEGNVCRWKRYHTKGRYCLICNTNRRTR